MPRIGFFTQNHKHFRFLNTLLETSARAFQPQTASPLTAGSDNCGRNAFCSPSNDPFQPLPDRSSAPPLVPKTKRQRYS